MPGGRKLDNDLLWFKFEVGELLRRDVIQNWPSIRKRPILKEYMYFDREFLLKMNWIEKRFTAEGAKYFAKNDVVPLKVFKEENLQQILYFDPEYLKEIKSYMDTVLQNPKNKNGSTIIEAISFFDPIRLNSLDYNIDGSPEHFRSYMFRKKGGLEVLVNGTLLEFSKLNYNELPNNLSTVQIWVGRAIMDWHWQRNDEKEIFNYNTDEKTKRVKNLKFKIPFYLDCYNYIEHIGRFRRFPENAWLMFLNVKQPNGEYNRPYRVINQEAYLQEEANFYAVPRAKLGEFFNLAKDDNEFLAIFNKVENEKKDAEVVWMSDVLLGMQVRSDFSCLLTNSPVSSAKTTQRLPEIHVAD